MGRSRNPLLTSDAGTDLLPDPPPGWATGQGAQTPDTDWFLAGAALAALHSVAIGRRPAVPRAPLVDRLAFAAAEASLRMQAHPEMVSAPALGVTGAVDRSAVPCGRGATPASAAAQLVRARNAPVSIHQLWLNASSFQRLARAPRV